MDFRLNRGLYRQVHNSRDVGRVLERVAQRGVSAVAAATPVDTSGTRESTRAEGGHRSSDGRSVAARIVQGGAAVQQQFGNSVEHTPARQFDRARGAL